MFSVIFPGQGSQSIAMGKNLYERYDYIKDLFVKADQILEKSISKIILEGPKEILDLTENTQPAVFLVSYSIFETIKRETNINLNNAKYFAGHSLGEYSALSTSGSIDFENTIKLLQIRGRSMQNAVPKGEGGMLAVLGADIENIKNLLDENKKKYECFLANDNSKGQVVLSGKNQDLNLLVEDLNKNSIKSIKLSVSAPFHCKLMSPSTEIMKPKINQLTFNIPQNSIVSNVTAKETKDPYEIKDLLIRQIESPVKWRESILYMANKGVKKFVEIGPGKILSGLIKRIDRNLELISVNDIDDIKNKL